MKISASKNYISIPDLSIINSKNLNIKWNIEEDPIGSNHLPIKLFITGKPNVNPDKRCLLEGHRSPPRICLGDFDKDLFAETIKKKFVMSINLEGNDSLSSWYDLVMESALQAGAIVYDGKGNKKFYSKNAINIVANNIGLSKK